MNLPELLVSTTIMMILMLMLWTSFLTTLQCVSVYVRPPYEEQAYMMDTISLVNIIRKFLCMASEIFVNSDGAITGKVKVLDSYIDFNIQVVQSDGGVVLVVNGVPHRYDNITRVKIDASHMGQGNILVISEYIYSVQGVEKKLSKQFMIPLVNMMN
ncbi:MAG: hypothetical protein J7L52_08750 [Thermotogae bacterium]|nr:hypothetical protein [Thermotogota bacterium]